MLDGGISIGYSEIILIRSSAPEKSSGLATHTKYFLFGPAKTTSLPSAIDKVTLASTISKTTKAPEVAKISTAVGVAKSKIQ